MAEISFEQLCKTLSWQITCNNVSSLVESFEGGDEKLELWLRSIETFAKIHALEQRDKILIALRTSKNVASDFVQTFLERENDGTWESLKTELTWRFGKPTDFHLQISKLRTFQQNPDENIQIFADRFLNLAKEIFGTHINLEIIQKQLVGIFTDGISSNAIKTKLIRIDPKSFEQATKLAVTEENTYLRLQLRLQNCTRQHESNAQNVENAHAREFENSPFKPEIECAGARYMYNSKPKVNLTGACHTYKPETPIAEEHMAGARYGLNQKPEVDFAGAHQIDKPKTRVAGIYTTDMQEIKPELHIRHARKRKQCFFCHTIGHFAINCRKRKYRDNLKSKLNKPFTRLDHVNRTNPQYSNNQPRHFKMHRQCYFCRKFGHLKSECRELMHVKGFTEKSTRTAQGNAKRRCLMRSLTAV